MNKAGSTAIQNAFKNYSDSDLEYLQLGMANHSHMVRMRFAKTVPARFYEASDLTSQQAERARAIELFDRRIASSTKSAIISAENFSNSWLKEECQHVIDELKASFDQTKGLIYVREPLGYICSLIQQHIKTSLPKRELVTYCPRYQHRLKGWSQALDRDDLDFVLFDPVAFHGEDLLDDFSHRVGASKRLKQNNHLGKKRANQAISAEAAAVLYRLRVHMGGPPTRGPIRNANVKIVRELKDFGSLKIGIAPEMQQWLLDHMAADISWVEGKMGRSFTTKLQASDNEYPITQLNDLAELGRAQGAALHQWHQRAFPKIKPIGETPEAILQNLLTTLADQS